MSAWIPTAALAKELGVTRRTVLRWAENPFFPRPKVFNHRLYFVQEEVEAWKKACQSYGSTGVTKNPPTENNQE